MKPKSAQNGAPPRRRAVALVALCVSAVGMLSLAGPAQAAFLRSTTLSVGTDGTAAGANFGGAGSVPKLAYNQAEKRLYVLAVSPNRIHGFSVPTPTSFTPLGGSFPLIVSGPGGEPGIAVSQASGNIAYVSESAGQVFGFTNTGAALPAPFPINPAGPKDLCGISVDPTGNVWIGDYSTGKARKYDAAGNSLSAQDILTNPSPCHLDFDSNGDLYVASYSGATYKMPAATGYTEKITIDSESTKEVAVDRINHRIFVVHENNVKVFDPSGGLIEEFGKNGTSGISGASYTGIAINEAADIAYVADNGTAKKVRVFNPPTLLPDAETKPAIGMTRTTATINGTIGPAGGPDITDCYFEWGTTSDYLGGKVPCDPEATVGTPIGVETDVSAELAGLTQNTLYHYRVVATTSNGSNVAIDATFTTQDAVKDLTTGAATAITGSGATLNGSFDGDNLETSYYFQWGASPSYGNFAPVSPPGVNVGSPPGPFPVSASITGLSLGATYHFRLVAINSLGTTLGADETLYASERPLISNDVATDVNTDSAILRADINPAGLSTTYHFEYGGEDCELIDCADSTDQVLPPGIAPQGTSTQVGGLQAGQTYHFRVVATNARGTTTGEDRVVKTYLPDQGTDSCENSLERQQSGSSLLLDCRAYELVSAANAGGYDVSSDLVPGQVPLGGYPDATDKVLYSVHAGLVPGIAGNPTNFKLDPYVASRDEDRGWSTAYVGLPANGMSQQGAFGSPLLGADAGLESFAFGGPDVCDPCFADGSVNVPLRHQGGAPVKGMAGTLDPVAGPVGFVAEPFSADGSHFIFGSAVKFEDEGNEGSTSIYDRDLDAGGTQVVSTLPDASTMSGEVGALGVSEDGQRIVVATKVSTDSAGNAYWHPYLHIGDDQSTVDLAPSTTTGVLFAGLSADGQKVFYVSKDELLPADTDESVDLYEAAVDGAGDLSLALLSTGTGSPVGDSDDCDPTPNPDGENWNAVGASSAENCGVLAIAGSGGLATEGEAIYFLSPEKLDGEGSLDQPNLFLVLPGQAPRFVATLDPDNPAVRNALKDSESYRYGDFQVTPDGNFAAFDSDLSLTDFNNLGHSAIYLYDVAAEELGCASCSPTFAAPSSDTALAEYGLGLSEDGRVFFTSEEAYVLRDTNGRKDAYEWSDGVIQLVSSGAGPADSGLLSISADGVNAYFFTRDTLVNEDKNGSTVKIYDAREGGGYLYDPPPFPCAASDECHGAGSQAPPPPSINTVTGAGSQSPPATAPLACKKPMVKRRGKCVKRNQRKGQKRRRSEQRNSTGRHG